DEVRHEFLSDTVPLLLPPTPSPARRGGAKRECLSCSPSPLRGGGWGEGFRNRLSPSPLAFRPARRGRRDPCGVVRWLPAQAAAGKARAEHRHTQSQYERLGKAGQGGILDKENVAEARYLFEAAQAGVEKALADVSVAEERAEVPRKRRDYASTLLQYAQIRA